MELALTDPVRRPRGQDTGKPISQLCRSAVNITRGVGGKVTVRSVIIAGSILRSRSVHVLRKAVNHVPLISTTSSNN